VASSGLGPTGPCLSCAEDSRAGCRTPGGVSLGCHHDLNFHDGITLFKYPKAKSFRKVDVGLSRAPSAVQLMREDVLELVGHKPWEEGS